MFTMSRLTTTGFTSSRKFSASLRPFNGIVPEFMRIFTHFLTIFFTVFSWFMNHTFVSFCQLRTQFRASDWVIPKAARDLSHDFRIIFLRLVSFYKLLPSFVIGLPLPTQGSKSNFLYRFWTVLSAFIRKTISNSNGPHFRTFVSDNKCSSNIFKGLRTFYKMLSGTVRATISAICIVGQRIALFSVILYPVTFSFLPILPVLYNFNNGHNWLQSILLQTANPVGSVASAFIVEMIFIALIWKVCFSNVSWKVGNWVKEGINVISHRYIIPFFGMSNGAWQAYKFMQDMVCYRARAL
jgi:hypothetical protein